MRSALPFLPIATIAFLLRLITAAQLAELPLVRTPQLDSREYFVWASRIAAGDFTWPTPPPHAPGYPLFLGLVLAISGGSLFAVHCVQAAVGALTCWFTGSATRTLFGNAAGTISAALLALYAPLIWIDSSVYAEGLLICLLAAFLWSLVRVENAVLATVLLAAAVLVRPTALALLPILFVFGAKTWRGRAMLAGVIALVATTVAIASWRIVGQVVPLQAYSGLNVYIGNSPLRDGLPSARPGGDWNRIESDAATHGHVSARDEDRYFMRKTVSEIEARPLASARLALAKIVWTFQNDEIRDSHSFYFFRQFSLLVWLLPFAVVFGFGMAGMLTGDWADRPTLVVIVYIVLTAATTILLVVGSRYRMPMVAGLAIFAGGGIARLRNGKTALPISIAVVAALLTLVWIHGPSHNFAEEYAFSARSLEREGNFEEAETTARRAISLDPHNALAFDSLGAAYFGMRRYQDAADALERAVALNSDYFDARLNLGNVYLALKKPVAAERQFFAAMQIDPRDARPVKTAAEAAVARGDLAEAASLLSRATKLDRHDPVILWSLARLEGALGNPRLGLDAARQAARLQDPNADDWLLTATLALDAGRMDVARDALDRADALGVNSIRSAFTRSLLLYRTGDFAGADRLVTDVVQSAPNFGEARRLQSAIGRALARNKKPAGANAPAGDNNR